MSAFDCTKRLAGVAQPGPDPLPFQDSEGRASASPLAIELAMGLVLSRPPLVLDALELPDGVAGDVELERGSGRGMPVVVGTPIHCDVLGLRNFEFHLG